MSINILPFALVNFFSGQDWDNYYYYTNLYNNIKKNLWTPQESFYLAEEVNRAKIDNLLSDSQYTALLKLIDVQTSEYAPEEKVIDIKTPSTIGIEVGDKYVEFLKLIRNVATVIVGGYVIFMGIKIYKAVKK